MNTTLNYEALKQFEATSTTLAYIYRELINQADDVNRQIKQLNKVTQDNANEFSKGNGLFWGESTTRTAEDFERALAKYEVTKRIFVVACDDNNIEQDTMTALLLQAQGATQ